MNKRNQAYLKRKLLGGAINQQGNDYEQSFTCYKIMCLIQQHANQLHLVTISSQADAFVDDLYIYKQFSDYTEKNYYQLKTSHELSWGCRTKIGTLHFDFFSQKNLLAQTALLQKFQLYLVVCHEKVHKSMTERLPPALKRKVSVELFPYYNSINTHISYNKVFKTAAMKLCAYQEIDKLEALAACILGTWAGSNKQNITLSQILQRVRSMGYSYLRAAVPPVLDHTAVTILNQIPGFHFEIIHGYFSWTFSTTDKGQIPYPIDSPDFRNIEQNIIAQVPVSFNELELIIT